jgi:hypothetical protein
VTDDLVSMDFSILTRLANFVLNEVLDEGGRQLHHPVATWPYFLLSCFFLLWHMAGTCDILVFLWEMPHCVVTSRTPTGRRNNKGGGANCTAFVYAFYKFNGYGGA